MLQASGKLALFIGGPKDGRWEVVRAGERMVRAVEAEDLAVSRGLEARMGSYSTVRTHDYRPECIEVGSERHVVWVSQSVADAPAMFRMLLEGYRRPR